jgi:hypothetical protein
MIMKIVQVTYTTKAEYAEQNCANIKTVMSDLQALQHKGIHYTACLDADGKSFIHTAFFESDEDQKTLNALASFKHFQQQLKENGLEVPPKQSFLSLVGTTSPFFN